MAFWRRWLLILSVLIVGGGQLFAASREERAYATAVTAFQDEVWDRAESDFAQFGQRFPKSGRLPEAALFQAQAQFKQGKFADAVALLNAHSSTAGAPSKGSTTSAYGAAFDKAAAHAAPVSEDDFI